MSGEGESLDSRWGGLTMTPLTQAYHSRCLSFGNAARVVEYNACVRAVPISFRHSEF